MFGEQFDPSAFQAAAGAISFRGNAGTAYKGANAELRRRGSPDRNLIGRALDFFALHDANERVKQEVRKSKLGDSAVEWLPGSDWMDV